MQNNIYDKISNDENISDSEFMNCNERPIDLFRAYETRIKTLQALNNINCSHYEAVVEQNKSLQKELKEIKQKPFFPYELNSGNNMDFGEFILISHAWFNISNIPFQLGIVEVEWKQLKTRKMYLGAGMTGGKNFKQDVLSIALHGQKIKDSSED